MKAETSSNGWSGIQFNDGLAVKSALLLLWLAAVNEVAQTRSNGLASAVTGGGRAARQAATIPFPEIGARTTANYQGDALGVTATADGALALRLPEARGPRHTRGAPARIHQAGRGGQLRLVAVAAGAVVAAQVRAR